jgi:hypothetical protein
LLPCGASSAPSTFAGDIPIFLLVRELPPIEFPGEIGSCMPGKSLHGCPLPDRPHVGLARFEHRGNFLGLFTSLELLPYLVR